MVLSGILALLSRGAQEHLHRGQVDLLKFQLDNEARFIGEIAKTDNLLILVLPGNYQKDSLAPCPIRSI